MGVPPPPFTPAEGDYAPRPREGLDYYTDARGLLVMTAHYHRARGYCCGNACRHCPYDYAAVPDADRRAALLAARCADDDAPDAD